MAAVFRNGMRSEQAGVERVACPLCGGMNMETLLDGADLLHNVPGRFGVERCGRCGFAFTNPRPDAESIAKFYPDDYVAYQTKEKEEDWGAGARRGMLVEFCGYPGRRSWARRLALWPAYWWWRRQGKSWLWPEWAGKGRVLDVGCGSGRFLWRLSNEHWSVKGLDISRAAASTAKAHYGIEVSVGTYPAEHFGEGAFDLVTMWNSLEHMSDPVGVLASAGKVLSAGGRVIVAVPNFGSWGARHFCERWFPLDLPRHLNHFTVETLGKAFAKAGFKMERSARLRRTSSLRRSARYAIAAGDRRALTLLMATRAGAGMVGRLVRGVEACDLVIAMGRKR